MLTRTRGILGHNPVRSDPIRRNPAPITQELNQLAERCKLTSRRPTRGKIAHKTNPDPMIIVIIVRRLAVCTVFLLLPTRTDLNLTITSPATIPNHKVIPQLIPTLRTMTLVEKLRRTLGRRAMMYHDLSPAIADLPTIRHPFATTSHIRSRLTTRTLSDCSRRRLALLNRWSLPATRFIRPLTTCRNRTRIRYAPNRAHHDKHGDNDPSIAKCLHHSLGVLRPAKRSQNTAPNTRVIGHLPPACQAKPKTAIPASTQANRPRHYKNSKNIGTKPESERNPHRYTTSRVNTKGQDHEKP